MRERLVFAMNIGSEELRALRQIKNRAQVYNFGGRFCDRRKRARKKFEIALFSSIHTQASLTNRLQQQLDFQTVEFMVPREKKSCPKEYQTVYFIDEKAKERMGHMAISVWNTCENRHSTYWCYKEYV